MEHNTKIHNNGGLTQNGNTTWYTYEMVVTEHSIEIHTNIQHLPFYVYLNMLFIYTT